MRRTISTLVLLVIAMAPISGYPQLTGVTNPFGGSLGVTSASVGERAILTYAADFPGQGEDGQPIRLEGDVLITYDFRGFDANGNLVAEFSDEVLVDGASGRPFFPHLALMTPPFESSLSR